MTLRDAVIQVLRPWVENSPKSYYYDDAPSAALDALLDYLDAHAEEWIAEAVAAKMNVGLASVVFDQNIVPRRLVAALRGTTGEGET